MAGKAENFKTCERSRRARAGKLPAGLARFFRLQHLPFALHAPAIAGQRTVGAHHAMARHHQRHAIDRAGASHGARCVRIAHLPRQLAVRARLAARNLPQRLPHAKLKNGPAQIQVVPAASGSQVVSPRARSSARHPPAATATNRAAMSAAGNSSRSVASASADVAASDSQHSPRSVAPTTTHPNGDRAAHQPNLSRPSRPGRSARASFPAACPHTHGSTSRIRPHKSRPSPGLLSFSAVRSLPARSAR